MDNIIRYVAFLRGINVGGHGLVNMANLKRAFEGMGFENVRTLLASGNVLFESRQSDPRAMARKIGSGLKKLLKKDVGVAVRSRNELEKLRAADPFKGIDVTPSVRLYVTFLGETSGPPPRVIPLATPESGFRILQATSGEVFSVVDLSKGKGTPEAMRVIEKIFGSHVTTRNWDTVRQALR